MKLWLIIAAAVIATLPSMGLARLYLQRRQITPANGTVETFMKVAPGPLKGALIAINFMVFGIMVALVFMLIE